MRSSASLLNLAWGGLLSLFLSACGSENGTSGGAAGQPGGAGTNAGNAAGGSASGTAGGGTAGGGDTGAGGSTAGAGGGVSTGGSAGAGGGAGTSGTAGLGGGGAGGGSSSGCSLSATDDEQPLLLSQTGCVDMTDPAKPARGLIPYSVRSPLWSDSAKKERFVRVPDGKLIHALDCAVDVDACKSPGLGGSGADEGHWDFPVGTVLVKNFSLDGKHIETRLLMRRTSLLWKGFSYEWNDAGTEATLLPDNVAGKDKLVSADQVWHYPSRSQCMECHTKYAGRSLGPTTAQMNSDFPYADGTMNQVEKFKQLGLFDAPPKNIPGYPDPAGTDPLEVRARSYLHTNCAICHRPGGELSQLDMRFGTPFGSGNLCGEVERNKPDLAPLRYSVVPGAPEKSVLYTRMRSLDKLRMPKSGSTVVDQAGSKLIADWIQAIPTNACPLQSP